MASLVRLHRLAAPSWTMAWARRGLASAAAEIDVARLQVERTAAPKAKTPLDQLVFGRTFADHMLTVDWEDGAGWSAPRIAPYGPLVLDPSSLVFHYAIECFEGMKAYRDRSGAVRLFRPMENMKRLNLSATRLLMPAFDKEQMLACLTELLKVDREWIPQARGYSLYIRPTMIGTQASLGVSSSSRAKLFVINCPVGPYYPTGFKPVSLYTTPNYVRAWHGGAGGFKIGGNYAPGILPQQQAARMGYQQILWTLDDFVSEVGTMNMFVFWRNKAGETELITPPLDGTLLPGITRDSILQLARGWNEFRVSEAPIKMADLVVALQENRVIEAFGAGTAAIVSPICRINYRDRDYHVPLGIKGENAGELTQRLLDSIIAIQYGEVEHPWSVVVAK